MNRPGNSEEMRQKKLKQLKRQLMTSLRTAEIKTGDELVAVQQGIKKLRAQIEELER